MPRHVRRQLPHSIQSIPGPHDRAAAAPARQMRADPTDPIRRSTAIDLKRWVRHHCTSGVRTASLAVVAMLALRLIAATADVVNVFSWTNYIDAKAIPTFEERTGIKVNYDLMDSNDVLEAKLLAGKSGYDVVV